MSGKYITDTAEVFNMPVEGPVREKILKLGQKITDRKAKVQPGDPEYYGVAAMVPTDEMAEIALRMKLRTPYNFEQMKKMNPELSEETLRADLKVMLDNGIIEFSYINPQHEKQYTLPVFVMGSAEYSNMNVELMQEHPEVARFFERMTFLPLKVVSAMVPEGGGGIGMHTIPVENAIPADCGSIPIEHISHWLDKWDKIAAAPCSCRMGRKLLGEGDSDDPNDWCLAMGPVADYIVECKKGGHFISKEEALKILQKAEDNGFVHQITNMDGPDKIIAICNCNPDICNALRTSQLFNTPNLSRSAYVAHVTPENCVACGRCVEYCPAGAVRLGQKLCTKDGPVKYPKHELPDDFIWWGEEHWDLDYRDNNRKNCYDTGTAPCKTACPAHIAVQGYLKMAAQGRYTEALALIKKMNPFPAVCGAICNKRCEDECTRGNVDRAVAIDEVKKFIAKQDLDAETRYIPPVIKAKVYGDFEQKIAVIGAGPAGMACAYYLATAGFVNVTVFEKNPVPGGMLVTGVPSFRLEKDVLNAEIDILKELGVTFKCGVEVGRDITIQQLRDEGYMGFCVAIGAQNSAKLHIPGEELCNVSGGVDFLREVNLGKRPELGKKVIVVGGGNVAIDVCRTAARLGAETTVLYRRSREEMPASADEVAEAEAEGIRFRFLSAPVEILGDENGHVRAVKVEVMDLGEPDEKGRRKPVPTGNYETLDTDAVISSVGQTIDWGELDTGAMVKDARGRAEADTLTLQTAQEDIFVCGDVFTGPKFAIDAIAAGHEAAISLKKFVTGGHLTIGRNRRDFIELDKDNLTLPLDCFDRPARQVPGVDRSKVMSFSDERLPFTEEQVKAETARCLGCGASVVDENKCIGCGVCTTKCDFDAIHLFRERPKCSTMIVSEKKIPPILNNYAKRVRRIAIKNMKGKVTGGK
ncbi:MAG: FAD-dependent oxidoreductase [Oscillospiraceae bacterium]|nr:FAD-dependent oxidoreductase [Oscillospiraceae bacterium]